VTVGEANVKDQVRAALYELGLPDPNWGEFSTFPMYRSIRVKLASVDLLFEVERAGEHILSLWLGPNERLLVENAPIALGIQPPPKPPEFQLAWRPTLEWLANFWPQLEAEISENEAKRLKAKAAEVRRDWIDFLNGKSKGTFKG
jgi:hypothetical protein